MQKSGFFNALLTNGEYDRKYNANDYCDNLAVVISNGVLRGVDDDLNVTSAGMVVSVGVGRAWINGHYYLNDTPYTFAPVAAPIGGTRYDRVFLRLDKNLSVRSISLVYQQGEAGNNPTKPAPVRDGNIYDIVLADIHVGTNATSVTITDTRGDADLCGWVYSTSGDNSFFTSLDAAFNTWFDEKKETLSSVTLFKRYNWRKVLTAAAKTVTFSIPQYDPETCFIEVYVNGVLDTDKVDYTLANSVLTFTNTLVAGTEIEIKCFKSIDGTGIMTVADEITELQNAVAALNTTGAYEYICNGVNDNVKIGEIVRAFQQSNGYGTARLSVYGTFGATAPARGSGTQESPYAWFVFEPSSATTRQCIIDFTSCTEINLPIMAGTRNFVFFGNEFRIIGANVIANQPAVNTVVRVFNASTGALTVENCRFLITADKESRIGQTGLFIDCYANVANVNGNSYCFLPYTDSILRLIGGTYLAYTGGASYSSTITAQSGANAVTILYGVNAPTVEKNGYNQTNAIIQFANSGFVNCTDLITTLPISVITGRSNIRDTIPINKTNAI